MKIPHTEVEIGLSREFHPYEMQQAELHLCLQDKNHLLLNEKHFLRPGPGSPYLPLHAVLPILAAQLE